jgi:FtsP/CotA-like multicopper oxidase with cupredoxin domain
MNLRRILLLTGLALAMTGLPWGVDHGLAKSSAGVNAPQSAAGAPADKTKGRLRGTTMAQRYAAAANAAAARSRAAAQGLKLTMAVPVPGGTPDYFGIYPNYANSPLPTVVGGVVTGGGIRKFIDSLPGLGAANASTLGQFIPIATKISPPAGVPNDGDYYELGVFDYTQPMHRDLPATTQFRGYKDLSPGADGQAHYLGPLIIAKRNVPVRVKFSNRIAANSSFFLPVDTTIMGAGLGPQGAGAGNYSNNRATLHLHGGDTPWISDGTPHQWVVPPGESTSYVKGVSTQSVPDMPDPGTGAMTFYYPNRISSRLLFYHDHVSGLTRLNVYAGEAAGYLITDDVEEGLINSGVLPNAGGVYRYGIPLIIQDKTFVPPPAQLAAQDPTWNWGPYGNLWFPHVYMPNQNPYDNSGANAMGRWDYGPWFWPPYTGLAHGTIPNPYYPGSGEPPVIPGTPNPTIVPEAFMDTPLVNGAAYPYQVVGQQAYRFRVLNASNDRTLNLQLYYADPTILAGSPGYGTEVKMVPAVATVGYPDYWPTDGRSGGAPDPATVGPPIIQIGTEGGFLPAPVVIPSTPINYNYNRRDIVVLNISSHGLMLGPAERADIIVDFSGVPAGSKLILYNDAPAPVPAFDPRYDYFTGDPDQTTAGGAPATMPGYGPNTRTIMQFQVVAGGSGAYNLSALQSALPTAFAVSQPAPIVPESAYGPAYGTTYQDNYVRIQDTSFTFAPDAATPTTTVDLKSKAIQELFETEYGRMNATLGLELPMTNFTNQTTIPYYYIDPPSEIIQNGDTQYWKITHNGVDTHAIHFHLFNVQLINRVGWDGAIRPPDENDLGWKETVRMNPLEDAIVALRPILPLTPFAVPNSIRPLNPAAAIGSTMGFFNVDPAGNPAPVTNVMTNFGWEYVWHCHLLGHEENDMMRPMILGVGPKAPSTLIAKESGTPLKVTLTWKDNSTDEEGFTIQRSTSRTFPAAGLVTFTTQPNIQTYIDGTIDSATRYYYRVYAFIVVGNKSLPTYASMNADSAPSNIAAVGPPVSSLKNFLGTWDGQGAYFLNAGTWTSLSSPADLIAAGDLYGDGLDDLIGIWPGQDGVWTKNSANGAWLHVSTTARHIASGDMNGDGRKDLLGTWDGQGVYYKDSIGGAWALMASPASLITAGDLDGDGTDDLIGVWPGQAGVWVKSSMTGAWSYIGSSPRDIATGDMNGDGRADLVGTWDGQGVFYKDSISGQWVQIASPADQVTAGDLDNDGLDDLIGIWPGQGGVWAKLTKTQTWSYIASTARDIAAGKFFGGAWAAVSGLPSPMGGNPTGPVFDQSSALSFTGPGSVRFVFKSLPNLHPFDPSSKAMRIPGPGDPGFRFTTRGNLVPRKEMNKTERNPGDLAPKK